MFQDAGWSCDLIFGQRGEQLEGRVVLFLQFYFFLQLGKLKNFPNTELYKTSFLDVARLLSNDHIFPRGGKITQMLNVN